MARAITMDVDIERLHDICERYGIAELDVFGSMARGDAGSDSDVDILYTLRPGRHLGWNIEDLNDELADLFGRQVDLISKRAVNPYLRDEVLSEARLLYAA